MDKLMTPESLMKLVANAAQLTLKFNQQTKWVDVDFNHTVIEHAYSMIYSIEYSIILITAAKVSHTQFSFLPPFYAQQCFMRK